MNKMEKQELKRCLERIEETAEKRSAVPFKAMGAYTVEDMVQLRGGYDMIRYELLEIIEMFELDLIE